MKTVLAATVFTFFVPAALGGPPKYIPLDEFNHAVEVEGEPLLHTGQFFGKTLAEAMDKLTASIKEDGGDPAKVVKLNIASTDPEVWTKEFLSLTMNFDPIPKAKDAPALSFVVGKLADPDARYAVDAVAAGQRRNQAPGTLRPGSRVYISGQAEKGATPAEAARNTLAGLKKTLDWLGCTPADVVQAKAFLKPITVAEDVRKEFAALFEKGKAPPLVFVEWESSLPVEIELIANAPTPKDVNPPPVEFLTPPGMTASPVYCRVARVNAPETIYLNGLYSAKTDRAGPGEVPDVFAQLGDVLKKSDSDLHHLVKATYYVSANDVSTALNELRPKFYDPKRPPAASKATVAGVGLKDRSFTMDMIAVRKR